mmetsp:Transcript_28340/g.71146  ORF Transcript_28340/g.71146 Transcript_28340/m.71146 type:complete len:543 (-) Transcript_28340:1034-2662(-)
MDVVNMEISVVILLKVDDIHRSGLAQHRLEFGDHLGDEFVRETLLLLLSSSGGAFALVGLDLLLLAHKLGWCHRLSHLGDLGAILVLGQPPHKCPQVGECNHKVQAIIISNIEFEWSGSTLGTGPKRFAIGKRMIGRKGVEKMTRGVVKVALPFEASQLHAVGKALRLATEHTMNDVRFEFAHARSVQLLCDVGSLEEELVVLLGQTHKVLFEGEGAGPLHAVLVLEGEALEGAEGDATGLGVTLRTVVLGLEGDDHLHVALGAHGAALEERAVVGHTALIHVEAGGHAVERVHDHVARAEEGVAEHVDGLGLDAVLQGAHANRLVHLLDGAGGALALVLADVGLAEQKLPVEVAELDDVVVGDHDLALALGAHAHQRKVLEQLAADRTRAHHEQALRAQTSSHLGAERHQLAVVARLLGGAVGVGGRQQLHGVQIQETAERRELAAQRLEHLLRHKAAQEAAQRHYAGARRVGQRAHHPDRHLVQRALQRLVTVRGQRQHRVGVGGAPRFGQALVGRHEGVQRAEGQVQLRGRLELEQIHH